MSQQQHIEMGSLPFDQHSLAYLLECSTSDKSTSNAIQQYMLCYTLEPASTSLTPTLPS